MADDLIPGSQLPEPIDEERLKFLTEKLRLGQASEEDILEIANGHLRLALYYAAKYAHKETTKEDVFISDALFGLAVALSKAPEKLTHDNLTGYILGWMRKYLFKTLTEDRTVVIPYTTLKRRQKRGLTTEVFKSVSTPNYKGQSPCSMMELREVIQSCIKKDFEAQVIHLRELGKNDTEISEILQCSRSSVTMAKQAVLKRFDKAME